MSLLSQETLKRRKSTFEIRNLIHIPLTAIPNSSRLSPPYAQGIVTIETAPRAASVIGEVW
jgi:hypothetical protein